MFQNLRSGVPFYILDKNEPSLKIGEVVGVSTPAPQFGTTYSNGVLTQPKMLVDVKVSTGGGELTLQKLPADACIADFGTGMVVSESKDSMASEVEAFRAASKRALADVERHKRVVASCDGFLASLNPHLAKEAEQAKEIEGLKSEMAEMKAMLAKALGKTVKN